MCRMGHLSSRGNKEPVAGRSARGVGLPVEGDAGVLWGSVMNVPGVLWGSVESFAGSVVGQGGTVA